MLAQTAIKKCLWTEKKYDSCKIEKNLSNNTKESATQFSQINLVHQVDLDKTLNRFPMVKTVVANGRSIKEWVQITKLDPSLHFSINSHSKECYFESITTYTIDSTMQTNQSDLKSPKKALLSSMETACHFRYIP